MMLPEQISPNLIVAAVLASLAVAIAFGPELGRAVTRLRSRRVGDVPANTTLEPQQF